MKKFMFTLAVALPVLGWSQSSVLSSGEEQTPDKAVKVMVIPFHPVRYYFSDCDKDVSQKSKVQVQDIRNSYRAALDYASETGLEKKYEPINLFQMKDSVSKSMLDRFYDNVSYSYDVPTRPKGKAGSKMLKEMKKTLGGGEAKKSTIEGQENYTVVEQEEDRYMKLSFNNPDFWYELTTTYDADFYVTINQFEVKTDYTKCIDRELGIFDRRIKVHYNIYNRNGKMVHGDVITARYSSNTNDINSIIQDNFGFLTDYITESLPK
jgi:hypothetical protein